MAFAARRVDHSSFVDGCSNLGLSIAKHNQFIDDPSGADSNKKKYEYKDAALKKMAEFKLVGENKILYHAAFERWAIAIKMCSDCESFEIKSRSRVLLGTGNASVFEYGFNLNYPWGVPYIPGSSLKGLLSSYMSRFGDSNWKREGSEKKNDAQVDLFGGIRIGDTQNVSYIGLLRFYDAWLLPEQAGWFETDIINSHYPGYYSEGNIPPDGTQNPIPVKIAALKPELKFKVCIQGPKEQRELAKKVLLEALDVEGIGGKTAVGYGRFDYLKSEDEKNAELITAIENVRSEDELVALYVVNRKKSILNPAFKKGINKFKYSKSLQNIWETFRPLCVLLEMMSNHELKSIREINKRYNDLNRKIEIWKEMENISELRHTEDAKKLFNKIIEQCGVEIKNNTGLNIIRDIAYGWKDINPDANEIMKVIDDNTHVWPPKGELKEFIESADHIIQDDKDILLELLSA